MGFYLRKAFSVGPFRFNLSKSGIGVSAGVKGLRIGSGPRGNYIHMGRGGLYYRASLPMGGGRPVGPSEPPPDDATNDLHEPFQDIESVSVLNMADSSSASLLEELKGKRKKLRLWPITAVIGMVILLFIGASFNTPWPVSVSATMVLAAIYLAYTRDQVSKTTVLFYNFDPEQEQRYQALHDAFDRIVSCGGKWHIEARGDVKDIKRSAGANTMVKRSRISPEKGNPPYVKANISVPFIPVGKQLLYFFPDRILVFDPNDVGAVGYKDLKVEVALTRFIEGESVPSDAVVVDRTWKYVNKKGGPDKRFKDNKEIPVVLYESVHLSSPSGLNELIHLSKEGVGEGFKNAVDALSKAL